MGIIYKATNLENGKIYIGQTMSSLKARMKNHIITAWKYQEKYEKENKDYNEDLFCVCYRNDPDGFDVIELESNVSEYLLTERENYWIDYYDSLNNGYNMIKTSKQYRQMKDHFALKVKPQKENKECTCEACLENQYYLDMIDALIPNMCKECYIRNRYD